MLTVQSSPGAGSGVPTHDSTSRSARLAVGIALVGFLVFLAVVGGSADKGAGVAQLRRGPASVVLSVLITLAGLAGVASLVMLIWGLVTRHRRSLDGSAPRRHSPILVAGVILAILTGLTALLALAARNRHLHSFSGAAGGGLSRTHASPTGLPFSTVASFTTSGIVVGIVAAVVLVKIVHSTGWRRVLRGLHLASGDADADPAGPAGDRTDLEALGLALGGLRVADPDAEPDPRRAVIACYLSMLDAAARHGPERLDTETPTEYLRRMLAMTGAGPVPATSLTELFERARYSERPVDESMRSDAIAALGSLRHDLLAGAVG